MLDEPTSGLDPLMEQAFRHCVHEAKGRGQTVFLSSHILSEVEALCDRVGILRDGRAGGDGDAGRDAPPLGPHRRGHLRRAGPRPLRRSRGQLGPRRGPARALPGAGPVAPLLKVLAGGGRERTAEPRAVARGAVPRPLRRGRTGDGRGSHDGRPVERGLEGAIRAAVRRRGTVVAALTARKAVRSGALWGYVFGIFVVSSAWSYTHDLQDPGRTGPTGRGVRVEPCHQRAVRTGPTAPDGGRLHRVQDLHDAEHPRCRLGAVGQHQAPPRRGGRRPLGGGAHRADDPPGWRRPGAHRIGRRGGHPVGRHRTGDGGRRPVGTGRHRRGSGPVLCAGARVQCGDVPGRRRPHQPAGDEPAPGGLHCRRRARA